MSQLIPCTCPEPSHCPRHQRNPCNSRPPGLLSSFAATAVSAVLWGRSDTHGCPLGRAASAKNWKRLTVLWNPRFHGCPRGTTCAHRRRREDGVVTSDDGPGAAELTPFERDVARVLSSLRRGDIVTYGEVAMEAGHPGAARAVGSLLRRSAGGAYPWWRVVTVGGDLVPGHTVEQATRLFAEGVEMIDNCVVPRS